MVQLSPNPGLATTAKERSSPWNPSETSMSPGLAATIKECGRQSRTILAGNLLEEVESRDRLGGRRHPGAYVIANALYDWSKTHCENCLHTRSRGRPPHESLLDVL